MEAGCLSWREVPHTTRLFADYTSDFQKVSRFFPSLPSETKDVLKRGQREDFTPAQRGAICSILERQNRGWGASRETLQNVERLRAGAAAVVTGQQVSLFGGPMYSLYKALHALKLAEQMTAAGGACVPIFWLATEDHDFSEIAQTALRAGDGSVHSLALAASAPEGTPVGKIVLGERGEALAGEAARLLGAGETSDILRESYSRNETLGNAFAKLFTRIFGPLGLVLLDPGDVEAHRLCLPLIKNAVAEAEEITTSLIRRGEELERAGYDQQVKVTASSTLLFRQVEGARTAVRRVNGQFAIGGRKITASELEREIANSPEEFSPNVLLRPVAQDFLLPTVRYIGGPAEVAYFAQAGVVYEKLLGQTTPIVPRFSATLVDARAQRLLQRYNISAAEMLSSAQPLRELLAQRSLPAELEASLAGATQSVEAALAKVSEVVTKLDPTLHDSAENAASKIRYQLEQVRGKAARAQLRRNEELERHAAILENTLHPNKNLQEREIAGVSFLAQAGAGLLEKIYAAIPSTCNGHHLLPL